jgi:N-acetylglucosamine kinase-like BadF-type ATPase
VTAHATTDAVKIVLGIDSGGTKTESAIANETMVLGRGSAAGGKLDRVGDQRSRAALHSAIERACAAARIDPKNIDRTCVGISGASRPDVIACVRESVSQLVRGEIHVVGDMKIAMEAAFGGTPGVIVMSGTGSVAYGVNERGEVARAGGWGPVVSDEGSGDWIGRRAVSTALRAHDNGQSTQLAAVILNTWRLATVDDIVLTANSFPRPDFAALVPEVMRVAQAGDPVAQDLFASAGVELAQLARTVIRRLWPDPRQTVRLCIGGGIFQNAKTVRLTFANTLRAERPNLSINLGPVVPVAGAIALARKPIPGPNYAQQIL